MLSGAADGSVTVWSAGKDWAELKTLTDHAAAVTALTVHDSGRVFLSTDAGGGLRLWSLVKGKAQFKTKLPAPADAALFAPPPAGDTYAIVTGDSVSVHSVEGGGVVAMGGAVVLLFFLPWLDYSPVKSIRYRPGWHKTLYGIFFANFIVLGYLGTQAPTDIFNLMSQIGTLIYLAFFFLMPIWSRLGTFKPVPDRVTFHAH
jgi:WD40 repeat protein